MSIITLQVGVVDERDDSHLSTALMLILVLAGHLFFLNMGACGSVLFSPHVSVLHVLHSLPDVPLL